MPGSVFIGQKQTALQSHIRTAAQWTRVNTEVFLCGQRERNLPGEFGADLQLVEISPVFVSFYIWPCAPLSAWQAAAEGSPVFLRARCDWRAQQGAGPHHNAGVRFPPGQGHGPSSGAQEWGTPRRFGARRAESTPTHGSLLKCERWPGLIRKGFLGFHIKTKYFHKCSVKAKWHLDFRIKAATHKFFHRILQGLLVAPDLWKNMAATND